MAEANESLTCEKCGKKVNSVKPILTKTSSQSLKYLDMCINCQRDEK